MTTIVTVRNFQNRDLSECRGLWRELVEWHREIYSDDSIGGQDVELAFDRHLAKIGSKKIWVAIMNDAVIGLIGLQFDGEEASIEPVIVGKKYRGKRVGKLLIEKVIDETQKKRIKYRNVSPVLRNEEAIRFFYEMGFTNIGHIQLFMDFSKKKWKSSVYLHGKKFGS